MAFLRENSGWHWYRDLADEIDAESHAMAASLSMCVKAGLLQLDRRDHPGEPELQDYYCAGVTQPPAVEMIKVPATAEPIAPILAPEKVREQIADPLPEFSARKKIFEMLQLMCPPDTTSHPDDRGLTLKVESLDDSIEVDLVAFVLLPGYVISEMTSADMRLAGDSLSLLLEFYAIPSEPRHDAMSITEVVAEAKVADAEMFGTAACSQVRSTDDSADSDVVGIRLVRQKELAERIVSACPRVYEVGAIDTVDIRLVNEAGSVDVSVEMFPFVALTTEIYAEMDACGLAIATDSVQDMLEFYEIEPEVLTHTSSTIELIAAIVQADTEVFGGNSREVIAELSALPKAVIAELSKPAQALAASLPITQFLPASVKRQIQNKPSPRSKRKHPPERFMPATTSQPTSNDLHHLPTLTDAVPAAGHFAIGVFSDERVQIEKGDQVITLTRAEVDKAKEYFRRLGSLEL